MASSLDKGKGIIESNVTKSIELEFGMNEGQGVNVGKHHVPKTNSDDKSTERTLNREMKEPSRLFSKLNPQAEEFFPPSRAINPLKFGNDENQTNNEVGGTNGNMARKRRNYNQERRKNNKASNSQIRRTVYVADVDHQVSEEELAALFATCGLIVDCRICGDPNSALRFAFIEFTDEDGARTALAMTGMMLGLYSLRVLPSRTAIAPVNPMYLPKTSDELEMCARTIYCTNIDKRVSQLALKHFLESLCGEVSRMRMLGNYTNTSKIAFLEFVMAESAIVALNCSGLVLGSRAIRISPSKTPVRKRARDGMY